MKATTVYRRDSCRGPVNSNAAVIATSSPVNNNATTVSTINHDKKGPRTQMKYTQLFQVHCLRGF